jgi:hypothetical protein
MNRGSSAPVLASVWAMKLAAAVGGHHMLHLHRFHHQQLLAGAHAVAFAHVQADDGAEHRRAHRDRAFGAQRGVGFGLGGCGRVAPAMRQHRQWVVGVDPGAGQPRRGGRGGGEVQCAKG